MEEKGFSLDVLFGQIQPELLRQNLLRIGVSGRRSFPSLPEENVYRLGTSEVSEEIFLHAAHSLPEARQYTDDDLLQRYRYLQGSLYSNRCGGILRLPAEYALSVLRFESNLPVCRQEHLLEWRRETLAMGQDLFTCAGLALRDLRDHCVTREFLWPAVLYTDHLELQRLLSKGVSENHFHLNGSTQMFSLAWCYLMNYPEKAGQYFRNMNFQENLKGGMSYGVRDNRISMRQRMYEAAWLRAELFRKVKHFPSSNSSEGQQAASSDQQLPGTYREFALSGNKRRNVHLVVKNLRRNCSVRFPQGNESPKCLDYALPFDATENRVLDSPVRLLSGERWFLYECFRRSYNGTFSQHECDLFYLYLLFKLRFREELVQVNYRAGFRNFAAYEKRKAHIWGDRQEYWAESYRLSVVSCTKPHEENRQRVNQIELRISPCSNPNQLKQMILEIDRSILYAQRSSPKTSLTIRGKTKTQSFSWIENQIEKNANFFYVIHFIKQPLQRLQEGEPPPSNANFIPPRNHDLRQLSERQAKATATALEKSSYLCSRIRGIDAANHEIGCRPETFATAFRYLRLYAPCVRHVRPVLQKSRCWPQLSFTYHVGEDCLDLADGLRAIDEAVCFLHLERGDRLGHDVALGLSPKVYYDAKKNRVFLPAQDLLDNLVWLLFRSLEWNVVMPSELRAKLQTRAERLLFQIYGNTLPHQGLEHYYQAWKLRGDDPFLYQKAVQNPNEISDVVKQHITGFKGQIDLYANAKIDFMDQTYPHFSSNTDCSALENVPDVRIRRELQMYLYQYHYNRHVRCAGQSIEEFPITPSYRTLIEQMQCCMMQKIMAKGLAIECNPSSNQLIGIYGGYENHPLFRFNNYQLPLPRAKGENQQLRVSVNTDDQGIFDTSLENEYALLYSVLQDFCDEDGKQLIDNDTIRGYLDHLREMGNDMVFPKANKRSQRRSFVKT